MGSPELIRRMTARRKEVETARQVLRSNQHSVTKEQVEQQPEADEICRGMRIDCEDLLNARGIVKRRLLQKVFMTYRAFEKARVLESSILDDKGEPIKLTLFSTTINPEKSSEIIVGIGDFELREPYELFLSLEKDHGNINELNWIDRFSRIRIRRANLQDANNWKEVVDLLKEQNRTDQGSPIEHR